ncbi:hypothetical protein KUCAC02_006924 [Chaenocephalus aceratus]|uniref:Uncharacterized protein n=1 Tax=Chaenocephalus aceratus TaxID=36190 RepID=A0ACB9VT47_CHAAC|nr:hypothetical protein KUCAC02_006924 [Chaenocephalus aceratus]
MDLIKLYNNNDDLNCPQLLEGLQRRFTMFNGGFGQEQLDWLHALLTASVTKETELDLQGAACHVPVHPGSTDPICLAWNYEELLAVIRAHSSVVCYMAGHSHDGGYCQDKDTGVHPRDDRRGIAMIPDQGLLGIQ